MASNEIDYKSPFPANSDLDLDMLQADVKLIADENSPDGVVRFLTSEFLAVRVYGTGDNPAERDSLARRIETMGDLYEELRQLEERATVAGLETEQARRVLGEFVAPKPFPRVGAAEEE